MSMVGDVVGETRRTSRRRSEELYVVSPGLELWFSGQRSVVQDGIGKDDVVSLIVIKE